MFSYTPYSSLFFTYIYNSSNSCHLMSEELRYVYVFSSLHQQSLLSICSLMLVVPCVTFSPVCLTESYIDLRQISSHSLQFTTFRPWPRSQSWPFTSLLVSTNHSFHSHKHFSQLLHFPFSMNRAKLIMKVLGITPTTHPHQHHTQQQLYMPFYHSLTEMSHNLLDALQQKAPWQWMISCLMVN